MNRYSQLLHVVDRVRPRTIVEVGTWAGYRAIDLIRRARQHQDEVLYLGFDLFEDATAETDRNELNVKPHHAVAVVEERIRHGLKGLGGVSVQLTKGNTRETLRELAPDLAFIDGGHSLETIESDFAKLQGAGVIVLDDFYAADPLGRCPDTTRWGCNELLMRLALDGGWHIHPLPQQDPVKDGGLVQMVEVTRA